MKVVKTEIRVLNNQNINDVLTDLQERVERLEMKVFETGVNKNDSVLSAKDFQKAVESLKALGTTTRQFTQALNGLNVATDKYYQDTQNYAFGVAPILETQSFATNSFIQGNENHIIEEIEKDIKGMNWLDDTDE